MARVQWFDPTKERLMGKLVWGVGGEVLLQQ